MRTAGWVLVACENDVERRTMVRILEVEGFTVFGVNDAESALRYSDRNIDLVLSDIGDESGLELLRQWKATHPATRLILISSRVNVDAAIEAIKSGAFDYIAKPFPPDELVSLVRRAIEADSR